MFGWWYVSRCTGVLYHWSNFEGSEWHVIGRWADGLKVKDLKGEKGASLEYLYCE